MTKLTYLLLAIRKNKHLKRAWLLSMFGVLPERLVSTDFGISVQDSKFSTIINGEVINIDGVSGVPFLDRNKHITLSPDDLPFIHEPIESTFGILVINAILILYPYQGTIPYINGRFKDSTINDIAYNALVESDDIKAHLRFENAINLLTVLSQTGVPSATPKSIIVNPKSIKLKAKLLKEHKDELTNPVVLANIQKQLIAADREYLEGDASTGFLIKKKSMESVRLRTMGMYGAEPDILDESKINVMTPSLSEGWGIDDIVMGANTIRAGSFARGQETALGGYQVKIVARIFQNYKIAAADCKTTTGLRVVITDMNKGNFIGRYIVGTDKSITKGQLDTKLGKIIRIRSPMHCITEGTGLCKVCMGDIVGNSGVGINSQVTTSISSFLQLFLAKVHSSGLSTKRYNYIDRIT